MCIRVSTWLLSLPLFGVETITLQGYGTRGRSHEAGVTCTFTFHEVSTDGERDRVRVRRRKEIAEEDEVEVDGGKKGGQEKETGEKQRRANDAGARAKGYTRG